MDEKQNLRGEKTPTHKLGLHRLLKNHTKNIVFPTLRFMALYRVKLFHLRPCNSTLILLLFLFYTKIFDPSAYLHARHVFKKDQKSIYFQNGA